jgi:eukaryotic-like serine/threonine-protein kinase
MQEPCLTGSRLGTYEVQALLGSVGISTTYRGVDLNLCRLVTLKVLRAMVMSSELIRRFRQEALLLARLYHPNIVRIYDFGEQDGMLYMVQEALPGPTLEQRLAKLNAHALQLDRHEILSIVSQVAAALDIAHAAGIVHRNVTPASIMWNADGAVVLSSFAIARDTLTSAHLTQAGVILGTPQYLSPEQALGKPATPASDIYALGVVLYELIAGAPPFTGTTPLAIGVCHVQDPPPPLNPCRRDLPAAVDAVVQRALAKEAALRFPSAGELVRALAQAWTPIPTTTNSQMPQAIHHRVTQAPLPTCTAHLSANAPKRSLLIDPQALLAQPPASVPANIAFGSRPSRGGSRSLLPFLALLLALLLLVGALLAWRGETAAQNAFQHRAALITSAHQGIVPRDFPRAATAP